MKKKFWTGRLKTILIVALIIAICAAVTLAITNGTSAIENVVGTILSPIRAGVASIDRLAERYYNYMFRYETLEAENAEMEKQILAMQEDIRDAEQLQRENEWLKALLKLSEEHEDYKFLTSYIISWDSSDYKSAFTIGKGERGAGGGYVRRDGKRAGRGPCDQGRRQLGHRHDDHGLVA